MLLKMPALLTTASSRPKVSTAASTIAWPPSGLSTESCDATARPPALRDLVDHLVGHARVGTVAAHGAPEVVDHHRSAPPRQVEGVEPAEPASGARHDRDLAFEVDHVALLADSESSSGSVRMRRGNRGDLI